MEPQTPFELLRSIEARSREKARGIPQQVEVRRPWSGMGFRVGDNLLVSSLKDVNEIMPYPHLTHVPHAKSWVKGVANVRGVLITVLDLRDFIEGIQTELNRHSRVLLIRQSEMNVGLLVDQALGLRHFFDEEQVSTLPAISEGLSDFVLGGYKQSDRHWAVFSMRRLLQDARFLEVAA